MNFQDIQNAILQRLRQRGVNWGNSPSNFSTDLVPPYWVKQEANNAYGRFLGIIKDYPIATLDVFLSSSANAPSIPLNPVPSLGRVMNPAVMQVYEMSYVPSGGQERYIPFVSAKKFRDYTALYQQRLGNFAAWPDFVTQLFGKKIIDMSPGTSVQGDVIHLTVCPDPLLTNAASYPTGNAPSCNAGGIMKIDSDIPLLPPDYHQAIVEGAVFTIAKSLDKKETQDDARAEWDRYVQEALDFGSTVAEGDAEQSVDDYYGGQSDDFWRPF